MSARDQTDEQPAHFLELVDAAVTQHQGVDGPAQEKAEPEDAHGRAVGGEVADRVQRPPDELMIAQHQEQHERSADQRE